MKLDDCPDSNGRATRWGSGISWAGRLHGQLMMKGGRAVPIAATG